MTVASYHALTRAPSGGAPLVFAFHGTGGDEHQFSALAADILPAAGLVAPRGDVCEHGALRFFRRTGEGIYDMEDLALRTRKMAEFVAAHRAENPDRPVYGFGYSNGANILAAVAFRHPDLFDRIALLHPLIPWTPEPSAGLSRKRVLVTGGRRDPICPPEQTGALLDYFRAQDARLELVLHDGGHELRQGEIDALRGFLTDTGMEMEKCP
jgi:phospholipase/carboxylesterase